MLRKKYHLGYWNTQQQKNDATLCFFEHQEWAYTKTMKKRGNTQIHKHTNTQTHKHANTQTHKHTNTQTHTNK